MQNVFKIFISIVLQSLVCVMYNNYQYRAGAFSGVRSYDGVATGGVRLCAVVSCAGETIDTCGRRFDKYEENTTAIFEELFIEASVPTPTTVPDVDAYDSVFYPVALSPSIMPLEPKDYDYDVKLQGDVTDLTLSLRNLQSQLYCFAIWGRVFAGDGQEPTPPLSGSSHRVLHPSILVIAVLSMNIFVYKNTV